jgi:protein involved in polysaccharide export with SLBB domain/Flp pilus assembly protein TadD
MKRVLSPIILLVALSPLCSAFAQTETGSQGQRAAEKTAPASSKKSGSDEALKAQETDVAKDLTGQSAPRDGADTTGANATRPANDNPASEDKASEARKYYESGIALFESGNLVEAIEKLKQAVKLEPGNAQAQYSLGITYSKSNQYQEAAESFKRAAHYKPDWAEAHFRLGWMYYVVDKRNSALEEYKKLLDLNSPLANSLWRILKDEKDEAKTKSPEAPASDAAVKSQPSSSKKDEPKREKGASRASKEKSSNATDPGSAASEQRPAAVRKESQSSVSSVPGPTAANNSTNATTSFDEAALVNIYRVGVGDVLDIRVLSSSMNRSTLYTVMDGGLIEFPMVGGSMAVTGLTTDEIRDRLAAELKRRGVQENAPVSVGVRQYASHIVIVAGLVGIPGTKTLRREAVPLYVVLAEAQPRVDAARAMISRAGSSGLTIDLGDQSSLNVLIRPGDVINLTTRPQDFYYIAGRVNYPGQKIFQSGITLLQAILAAGGLVRQSDNAVDLSREGGDGRLSTTRYNLKEIKSGKVQDPRLQPGDRIEVIH